MSCGSFIGTVRFVDILRAQRIARQLSKLAWLGGVQACCTGQFRRLRRMSAPTGPPLRRSSASLPLLDPDAAEQAGVDTAAQERNALLPIVHAGLLPIVQR